MEDSVLDAALSGLLHDVGKFAARANAGRLNDLDEHTRSAVRHDHALRSQWFVDQHLPKAWWQNGQLSGIAYHHQPQSQADYWIYLADMLSAAERADGEDKKETYLRTIFATVGNSVAASHWPLKRLQYVDERSLFPRPGDPPEWTDAFQREYGELWDDFEGECRRRGLTTDSTLSKAAYIENLAAVLQEFTWCIPAAPRESVADVPLFDHLRTTAALAACLAADNCDITWCQTAYNEVRAGEARQPTALLVGGDISGIQDFIYTLTSGGAAKSLRARSFYLQLLSEVIALYLLDTLALPLTNLLYSGGGGFQLLAPLKAKGSLSGAGSTLTDTLMKSHRGALGLNLAWTVVQAGEFARFGEVRERLGQALGRKKRRPFAGASTRTLADFIGAPLTLGGDPLKFCRVTGDDWDVQRDRQGEFKTGFVLSLEELGRRLPHMTHVVLSKTSRGPGDRPRTWQEGLKLFGYEPTIVSDGDQALTFDASGLVRAWRLDPRNVGNEQKLLAALRSQAEIAIADWPIAKLVPLGSDGELLTFDELAEDKARGIKRWGVLRLDVDNLGHVFREGLGTEAGLSRVASLSFALRLFFEGWLPNLAGDMLSDKLYIQYSGGDDVFVVGAWDALPEFALRIRNAFQRLTADHPSFTISGGIAIVEPNFPLYQAARMAGEAEDAAKAFQRADGKEKDAIRFLDRTCEWDELSQMRDDAEQLAGWTKTRVISAALLQVTQSLYRQIKQAETDARRRKRPKPTHGRWMWMAAYQITRILQSLRGESEEVKSARRKIETMQHVFLTPGAESERLGLTARWAQLLARGGK